MRIGTCSWKYDSWRGLVYPEFGEFNYLDEYSKKYNTVEIDQWFWSLNKDKAILPKPNVVEEYNSFTPDDFRFTVKMPNSLTLTHYYKSSNKNPFFLSPDLMETFCDSIEPIWEKIGMLMFQFEYLNKQKMNSLSNFLKFFNDFLNSINLQLPIGIEIRNPNYLNSEYFSFLQQKKITPVFLQGYFMPSITEVYERYKHLINDQIVIRLHGYDRKGIEGKTNKFWDTIIEPKDNELKNIVRMLTDLLSKNVDIYMNVNNHYEGSAPLTIGKLKTYLQNQ